MKRNLLVLFGLMFAIFACTNECMNEFLNECLNVNTAEKNNSGNNQTDIDNPVKSFTTLQQVVNDTNTGEEIDLSEYKDLTDYSATVNKTLTIKNGSLNNAKLQITAENVKLEKIEKVSVSTSSRLTITNSKLSDLLIGTSGETSRSTPSSSEMTLAMVTVTDSEIENVELNGFNSQLNITDTVTQIDDILISTKAKVILEAGSYDGMKDPTVINGGEVARVDMTKKTELSVLSIYSSPQKLEYNIGDEIDLAGLIVMGTYFTDVEIFKSGGWKGESSDTITKWEDEKDYTVSYDFNIPGVSIVTVTSTKYPEIKCNFHVFVKELQNSETSQPEKEEIEIEDIRVITFGTPKTLYKVGEKLDLSCYQVVGTYNGFEINLPFTSEPANGTPLTEENTQITFSYNGEIVDTQTITVTKLYYTVTFKDGEKTLYTLEVADGELLKLPVVDERTGYTFDGWYKNDGTKIEADYKVTEKLTLTASWNNANTTYKVEHYQQNIADNEYTLFETENKTGKTDENTSATAKDYAGFTAKTIEYAKIVADGSTVVGIYYDRKKITLTLNLDGGNGDESITGKYGADVTTPADPTKTGYTFAGWNLELPAAFPAENATYTAKWNANTYTVKFDSNGGSGEMTEQAFTYDVEQALTANTFTREGYTFAGWNTQPDGKGTSYADKKNVKNLTAEDKATVTLYAVWEKTPTYSGGIEIEGNKNVTFLLNNEKASTGLITFSVKSGDTFLTDTTLTITVYNHGYVVSSTSSLESNEDGVFTFDISSFPKDETYQFVVSCNYESITYTDTFTVKLSQ
ncbi:MAG: InlB B-repeat-containing protein [Spirochaetota bacterium]|nr:InlB B-repeat-containing protein [Spirochaetota bacterium]